MRKWSFKRIALVFIIAPIFVVVAGVSAFMIFSIQNTYRESAGLYDALTAHITFVAPGTNPQSPSTVEMVEEEETFTLPAHIALPVVDFDALREINPDTVGWIMLPDTQINYPVVQGADNDRYLNHLFDGRRNATGAIFVDSYNQGGFVDRNTIIYGHHMRDGSMFAVLEQYRVQTFFDAHPWIFLLTPERNYVIQLVAGYTADVEMSGWQLEFEDDAAVGNWISERRDRSDFISSVETRPTDRFVTLSTCSWAFNNARYVVVGRLIPIA